MYFKNHLIWEQLKKSDEFLGCASLRYVFPVKKVSSVTRHAIKCQIRPNPAFHKGTTSRVAGILRVLKPKMQTLVFIYDGLPVWHKILEAYGYTNDTRYTYMHNKSPFYFFCCGKYLFYRCKLEPFYYQYDRSCDRKVVESLMSFVYTSWQKRKTSRWPIFSPTFNSNIST